MTVGSLLNKYQQEAEFHDISLLLSELLHCPFLTLSLRKKEELSHSLLQNFYQGYTRLKNNEPIQYIIGKAWFYGLEFIVSPEVLIPRPETEGLIEVALPFIPLSAQVLDIGTGNGALAITLKTLRPDLKITATDISSQALNIAQQNADFHHCTISFHNTDLYPKTEDCFDFIISNPPYISPSEYVKLDTRIKDFEPKLALLAEENGLIFYRRILNGAITKLKPKGTIFFEHGDEQRQDIIQLAETSGFETILIKDDLAGHPRYLGFQKY
ncbi:MAG: peptide chain release factor N(5)-glutamine methyltransferase [Candidatus Cloacimonetes bacterium]|nr:peptide chain release factor N(5)-glutamine methyltransferase [Candidatus Cloacimonadota bacterium]